MGDDATPIHAPELERYWRDPIYRRRMDAEAEHARALCHATLDAHRDRELRRLGYID